MGRDRDKGPMYGKGDMRAQGEQLGALSRDIAPVLAGMYHGLVAEGVPGEDAATMASNFFGNIIAAQARGK